MSKFLIFVIASGFGKYFPPIILTALLIGSVRVLEATLNCQILLYIGLNGFLAMMGLQAPDRFEGDKGSSHLD